MVTFSPHRPSSCFHSQEALPAPSLLPSLSLFKNNFWTFLNSHTVKFNFFFFVQSYEFDKSRAPPPQSKCRTIPSPRRFSCTVLCGHIWPPPPTLTTSALLSAAIVSPFPRYHMNRIIQYGAFASGLCWARRIWDARIPGNVCVRSLVLSSIPLCGCARLWVFLHTLRTLGLGWL